VAETKDYPNTPDYATPPGLSLKSVLQGMGMSQGELAKRIGRDQATVSQIITGKAPITPEVAQRLENVTKMPSGLWLRMEAAYQDKLAKLRAKAHADTEASRRWVKGFPYAELARRGIVAATRKPAERVLELFRFFGVSSPESWRAVVDADSCVTFRRSASLADKPKLTSTWLRLARLESEFAECDAFSKPRFREALNAIRALTVSSPKDFVDPMKRMCTEAGVALVFVRKIPSAGITGATFWHFDRPVISMTIRGGWGDIFWFTFFHEACHVLKHGKKEVFIESDKGDGDEKDKQADEFASNILIPDRHTQTLRDIPGTGNKTHAVKALAQELGIHPGIVVGRLHHDNLLDRRMLNGLKTRFIWTKAAGG
jgi:addiction module HigA family antidote